MPRGLGPRRRGPSCEVPRGRSSWDVEVRGVQPGSHYSGCKKTPRKEVRGVHWAPLASSALWVCFLLLGVFPWLAPRKLQTRGAWDGLGVRGAQGPGRATAAEGWGGHDPDNPLCLTVTTGPARTRAAAVVFAPGRGRAAVGRKQGGGEEGRRGEPVGASS